MLSFGVFIILLAVALFVAPYRMARRAAAPTQKEDTKPHE